jgi:Protein of unknown function DUF262
MTDIDAEGFEKTQGSDDQDPDVTPIKDRKVVTQPYDLAIDAIVGQVKGDILFLRPLSSRPNFQRQYVWDDKLASKLIESVILNVPIPPCYLSENEDNELDVIDGQQRIYSLYRYLNNEFVLKNLEAIPELNGKRFFELTSKEQRKIKTHTLRCVVITNESHPEIKFDVFERLNTNTSPLNPQELRNCVARGALNDLLGELSNDPRWLQIRGRKAPDKRLADEEIILRFFAFHTLGLASYRTPQKHWLNEAARAGRQYSVEKIDDLRGAWINAIDVVLELFEPKSAFRRPGSTSINRALFDLTMTMAARLQVNLADERKIAFVAAFKNLNTDEEFSDLVSRAVDHKSRTERRFMIWKERIGPVFA